MAIVLIWCRNMLLPARRLTPMSAMAFTMYGAIVMPPRACVKSSFEGCMCYCTRAISIVALGPLSLISARHG